MPLPRRISAAVSLPIRGKGGRTRTFLVVIDVVVSAGINIPVVDKHIVTATVAIIRGMVWRVIGGMVIGRAIKATVSYVD